MPPSAMFRAAILLSRWFSGDSDTLKCASRDSDTLKCASRDSGTLKCASHHSNSSSLNSFQRGFRHPSNFLNSCGDDIYANLQERPK